ncbi:MAG: 2-oxo acid dehydrogenase subunit E2 [Chloroflexota bacterium]|nr:2-oxo acid dehydrogenase subunit E2 [Chloroflexota bacterium]
MSFDLKLPLLGDVMKEGKVVSWLQGDGAEVSKGTPLYDLETDKISFTVEAPADGILQQIVSAGEVAAVGAVVGRLLAPGEAGERLRSTAPSAERAGYGPAALPAERAESGPLGAGFKPDLGAGAGPSRAPGEVRATPAARRLARELGLSLGAITAGKRIREADVRSLHERGRAQRDGAAAVQAADVQPRITPAARRLAHELGVDLAVFAAGKRIREADVRASYEARGVGPEPAVPKPARTPAPLETRELAGRRRIIAERMHASLRQMAQLTISQEVDITEAMQLRGQLKQLWPETAHPTVTALVLRATALALREHPGVNATMDGIALTVYRDINLGLAVDLDEGLMVPVIRDAGDMPLRELAERSRALSERARSNQLSPDDLQGGTFTVTSLGALGIDVFTPIVNPPQVAILGIGRVFSKLALKGDKVEERSAMYLSLSFDHRALDGAPAARFLNAVKRCLELPAALLV